MLKAGTPCWLTRCAPHLLGKVVEVESFYGDINGHECYRVKSKVPLDTWAYYEKQQRIDKNIVRSTTNFLALRAQLVPIIDPDKKLDIDEWAPLQDDWKKYYFRQV
jgi:hypothetical protein